MECYSLLNSLFAVAGLRMKANYPGPLPGYESFYGQSLLYLYDKECEGTMSDGKCVLPLALPVSNVPGTACPSPTTGLFKTCT